MLAQYQERYGYRLIVLEKIRYENHIISSTYYYISCMKCSDDDIPDKILSSHLTDFICKWTVDQIIHLILQMNLPFLRKHQ